MNDLETKEFYRQMMVNITFNYLENRFFCYCPAGKDAVLHLSVEEFKNFVRVTFNVVFLSCRYGNSGSYIRLEGYADVSTHGKVSDTSIKKEYLKDIREVYKNE